MKKYFILLIIAITLFGLKPAAVKAVRLADSLKGRILLQVEARGEAWYINPADSRRYFLGRPADAFALMRAQGVGITDRDLKKIPVGLTAAGGTDSDGDGLADSLEIALGTDAAKTDSDSDGHKDRDEILSGFDPAGPGRLPLDSGFASIQRGRIFLQVEAHGEAWYINSADSRRYFLGRPDDAFALMRALGLGIKNSDLAMITAMTPAWAPSGLEQKIHELINSERQSNNLSVLSWDNRLAAVAREHSGDLAEENTGLTGFGRSCNYPLIHHEGIEFGAYNPDRLASRSIYYYDMAGENIALVPAASVVLSFASLSLGEASLRECHDRQKALDTGFKESLAAAAAEGEKLNIVKDENIKRQSLIGKAAPVDIKAINWEAEAGLAENTVAGWLASPGHRENILKAAYDETGIGVVYVNGYIITTQIFIRRTECGYETGACCEKAGYNPYCFTALHCVENVCVKN